MKMPHELSHMNIDIFLFAFFSKGYREGSQWNSIFQVSIIFILENCGILFSFIYHIILYIDIFI